MLPYRTTLLRALNKAFNHQDTSIFIVIKLSDQDQYVLITNSKETFMGSAEILMQQYINFILHFVRHQYLTLKARHGVADEPDQGATLCYIAELLVSDNLFIEALTQRLQDLTIAIFQLFLEAVLTDIQSYYIYVKAEGQIVNEPKGASLKLFQKGFLFSNFDLKTHVEQLMGHAFFHNVCSVKIPN
jgi:hypothetical protein